MDREQNTMKRFLKLGYSRSDITRVLQTLQHDAQTNDILQELIKTCHTTRAVSTVTPESSPVLIPRGCGSSPQNTHSDTHSVTQTSSAFRPVVIDGSNVAISHGNKVFSCRGIQLAVQWFWDRGIRDITVFVPRWRKEQSRPEAPITDQHILDELERRNILVYTPSRCVNGKRVVCYDDRYIVKLAYDSNGIIVSNDNYRDLQVEKPQWKKFIEERLLMYTFANDIFMPPDDPLGRNGPTIENFLRKRPIISETKQQHCPYGKKCTYGVKCKFYHPERSNQPQLSVADELRAKSQPCNKSPYQTPQDELTRALSSLDLYSDPADTSLHRCKSEQAYRSLEGSMSRLYFSDSALPSSLAYSSGSLAGSSCDYFLSPGCLEHRRARSPDVLSRCYSPGRTYNHYQNGLYTQSTPFINESHRYSPSSQQQPYRLVDVWGQIVDGDGDDLTEIRRDIRSQLGTLFPQSMVDQVMCLNPDILDTSELVMLIQKFRNSLLL